MKLRFRTDISRVRPELGSLGGEAWPPVMGGPRQATEAYGDEGPDDLPVKQDEEQVDSPDVPLRLETDVGLRP